MEKNANPQFIVKLNYQSLADMVSLDHIYNFDRENFNEKEILRVFNYYKGTRQAIELLGSILKNIEYSLELTMFIDDNNYPMKAEIFYQENDCEFINDDGYDINYLIEQNNKIRPLYIKEAKDTIKYYKEYFTRLYDRSRTV